MKLKKAWIDILSVFLIVTLLSACGSDKSSESSSGSGSGASQSDPGAEKATSDLTGLENNIEMTIKALGGPAAQQTQQNSGSVQSGSSGESQGSQSSQQGQQSQGSQSSQQGQQSQGSQSSQQGQQSQGSQSSQQGQQSQGSQSSQQGQQSQGSQSSQQGQQSQGGQSSQQGQQSQGSQSSKQGQQSQGGQSSQQSQASSQQNPADQVSQLVDQMHYQWNDLMPEAIKNGAKKDLVDKIDNALNKLSVTAAGKNKMNTLLAANQLYEYIPDLYTLIKPKPSPEIKRILYYSRNVILNASAGNWTQADSDIKSLESTWDLYKNSLSKDQTDLANKLELSINELAKVVKDRSQSLVGIKGEVEFSNIEALEKATESESGSGGQQSGESSQQSSGS